MTRFNPNYPRQNSPTRKVVQKAPVAHVRGQRQPGGWRRALEDLLVLMGAIRATPRYPRLPVDISKLPAAKDPVRFFRARKVGVSASETSLPGVWFMGVLRGGVLAVVGLGSIVAVAVGAPVAVLGANVPGYSLANVGAYGGEPSIVSDSLGKLYDTT